MKNREIKFRGLTTENKWVYGYLIKQGAYYFIQNEKGGNDAIMQNTICEFTGVLDKNGNEVFENDIISFGGDYSNETITFKTGCFGYQTNYIDYFVPLLENCSHDYEVIGNNIENN